MSWYFAVLKKYVEFSGRTRRKEFWMFGLFNFIILSALGLVEGFTGSPGVVSMLYALAVLIPGIAVTVRRLHDTDRSGWWILIALVPLIGIIVLIVFMAQDSTPRENRYGANPKTETA